MSTKLYIPVSSLNNEDIQSLVQLSLSNDEHRVDIHGGRKIAIQYLLNLNSIGFDLSSFINFSQLKELEKQFEKLAKLDLYKKEFDETGNDQFEEYWELTNHSSKIHQIAKDNRIFINQSTSFLPQQLKVYFNRKQLLNLPYSKATYEDAGFVDDDCRTNLTKYPLIQRNNQGNIHTKKGRIQNVIFDIDKTKQVIILDFADERMPGGLYLYGANTQEETMCYYSNAYRALLDFKYQRFYGGFFIPEFGCLYIKDALFFNPNNPEETRKVDIIAAACYDLTGQHGLYKPPDNQEQIYANTKKKLESVIAAAQANSNDNGENTYLILGPIGCGAFKNKLENIAKLWSEILLEPLNNDLNTQHRHAFEQTWFLSGTQEKLETFQKAFLPLDIK